MTHFHTHEHTRRHYGFLILFVFRSDQNVIRINLAKMCMRHATNRTQHALVDAPRRRTTTKNAARAGGTCMHAEVCAIPCILSAYVHYNARPMRPRMWHIRFDKSLTNGSRPSSEKKNGELSTGTNNYAHMWHVCCFCFFSECAHVRRRVIDSLRMSPERGDSERVTIDMRRLAHTISALDCE